MWVILVCVMAPFAGCDRADGVALARAAEWRADARLVDEEGESAYWYEPPTPPSAEAVPGIHPDARYASRRDCMRALRRALRAANPGFFRDGGDHVSDAIPTAHWNYPRLWACFQEAPLVG